MIQRKNGYSLVLIILMSTFILALLAGAMRVVTQSYIYSQEEYYYKLAQEAGEAGTAYANACLDSNRAEQSWSSAPGGIGPLHPETNCKGAVTFPGNRYVFENSKLRTTFEVGDLEASTKGASSGVALSAATAQISSTGRVEITNGSGTVLKTYIAVVKKSVTWPADIDAARIVSGTNRTCAILSNNVWCWGRNHMGQLGDGTTSDSNIPVKVRSVGDMRNGKIIDVFAAQHHSCALTEFNSVKKIYCWGDNRFGQLGNSDFHDSYSTVPIEVKESTSAFAGNKISAIGGTGDASCAIASGKVYCWGGAGRGQSGPPPGGPGFGVYFTRAEIAGLPGEPKSIGAGISHTCALVDVSGTNKVYCWGSNEFGQLGAGENSDPRETGGFIQSNTPLEVGGLPAGEKIVSMSAGANRGCVIMENKRSYCWGLNENGQIGDGTSGPGNYRFSPTESLFLRPVQNRYIY